MTHTGVSHLGIDCKAMVSQARVDKFEQLQCGVKGCNTVVASLELGHSVQFVEGFQRDPTDGVWRLTPRVLKQWVRAQRFRTSWNEFTAKGRAATVEGPGARRRYEPALSPANTSTSDALIELHFECPRSPRSPHLNVVRIARRCELGCTYCKPEQGSFPKQERYVDRIHRLSSEREATALWHNKPAIEDASTQ